MIRWIEFIKNFFKIKKEFKIILKYFLKILKLNYFLEYNYYKIN